MTVQKNRFSRKEREPRKRKTESNKIFEAEKDTESIEMMKSWSLDYSLVMWVVASIISVTHYLRFNVENIVLIYYSIIGMFSLGVVLFIRPDGFRFNFAPKGAVKGKEDYKAKRNYKKDLWRKWGSMVFSLLCLSIFITLFKTSSYVDIFKMEEIIVTATAEQLFFALVIPGAFVKLFPIRWKFGKFNRVSIPSYIIGVIISGAIFAIMHSHKYAGGNLAITVINGTLMILVGYWFPGISIGVHFSLNCIATL